MDPCGVCQGLLKPQNRQRLAFEFTPSKLKESANTAGCETCRLLLQGICQMEGPWSFATDVSSVYGYGLETATDTLTLEIYFGEHTGRSKLVLELFWVAGDGVAGRATDG